MITIKDIPKGVNKLKVKVKVTKTYLWKCYFRDGVLLRIITHLHRWKVSNKGTLVFVHTTKCWNNKKTKGNNLSYLVSNMHNENQCHLFTCFDCFSFFIHCIYICWWLIWRKLIKLTLFSIWHPLEAFFIPW